MKVLFAARSLNRIRPTEIHVKKLPNVGSPMSVVRI
jgi:hypothetical protein